MSKEVLSNALCNLAKIKATIKALEAKAAKLQANILQHPDAPQKFVIDGLGTLNQTVSKSYTVDSGVVIGVIGPDAFAKIAKVSKTDLKKGITSSQFAEVEAKDGISISIGNASYRFVAEKPKED